MHYLALALAARGLRVCHIVFDDPSLPPTSQGVELVRQPAPRPNDSLRRRVQNVFEALSRADASVYVQRSAGSETGLVGLHAWRRGRGFILSTSWDGDLALRTPMSRLARLSYRVGRRLARTIVVQTERQLAEARTLVDTPVHLIRSFAEPAEQVSLEREAFLWVGRIAEYKDPLSYLELAERLPQAEFRMIATGGDHPTPLSIQLWEKAGRLPNLQLLEPRPREQLLDLYRRALAVVNTSSVEGFPNTLLEGWSCGAAALSLRLDPDGVIVRYGLGAAAGGSIDTLEARARELWTSPERRDEIAVNACRYLREEHSPAVVGERWAALIEALLA